MLVYPRPLSPTPDWQMKIDRRTKYLEATSPELCTALRPAPTRPQLIDIACHSNSGTRLFQLTRSNVVLGKAVNCMGR